NAKLTTSVPEATSWLAAPSWCEEFSPLTWVQKIIKLFSLISLSVLCSIQLRYGLIWAQRNGRTYNQAHEIELFDGERIIQVSGKYHQSNYIYQLVFVTSRGRSLTVGQPTQHSFNFYTNNPEAELIILSGRYNGNGITSLGAHWGVMPMNTTEA
uniref:Jacalin-type lectin domain-containing protein n=1 Tax=Myripristis murdjan TaxID=586833 RepID=A0A668APH3_9TELE